jgi:hypothetical protein
VTGAVWIGLVGAPGQGAVAFAAPVVFRMLWVHGNLALWSQANALLDLQQVKRLTPVLTLGFVFGILAWGLSNEPVVRTVGTTPVVALDAVLLVGAAALSASIRTGGRPATAEAEGAGLAPAARRFVTTLLVYDAIATAGAYAVDYAFLSAVQGRFPERADSAVFLGRYMGGMTLAVLLVTATVSGRFLRRYGVRGGLAMNPLGVALAAGSALAAVLLGAPDLVVFALVVLAKGSNETAVPTFTGPAVRAAVQALPASHRVRVLSWYDGVVAPLAVGTTGVVLLVARALGGAGLVTVLALLAGVLVFWAAATRAVGRAYPALVAERLQPARPVAPPLLPARAHLPLDALSGPEALLALRWSASMSRRRVQGVRSRSARSTTGLVSRRASSHIRSRSVSRLPGVSASSGRRRRAPTMSAWPRTRAGETSLPSARARSVVNEGGSEEPTGTTATACARGGRTRRVRRS